MNADDQYWMKYDNRWREDDQRQLNVENGEVKHDQKLFKDNFDGLGAP